MIGNLNERITIQTVTRTIDLQGGATESWADKITVWGEVIPVSSDQRWDSERLGYFATHKITIRYRNDLNTSMRIKRGGTIYYIHRLIEQKKKGAEYLVLGVAEGGIS